MGEVLAAFSTHGSGGGLRPSASSASFFDSGASSFGRRKSSSFSDLSLATSTSSLSTPLLKPALKSAASGAPKRGGFSFAVESDSDDSADDDDDDDGHGLAFPAYGFASHQGRLIDEARGAPPASPVHPTQPAPSPADTTEDDTSPASAPDLPLHAEDDTAVKVEPSHHVDYLSYEWREEDIWSSWRHIVEHRRVYGERSRLENASWRTWAKNQFKLRTVSPETLNWMKECDVEWLYGPLQPASSKSPSAQNASEPVSRLSESNSFIQKKPILKKRTMSEVMLQKSISTSSLLKQAASEVQAQQMASGTPLERRRHRPILNHAASDFAPSSIPSRTVSREPTDYFSSKNSSGLQTPEGERKHIRFDETVEQCIAVDTPGDDDDDDDDMDWNDRNDSSDEDVVMMKRQPRKKRPFPRSASKTSLGGEAKIIAKLEPTTLKYRTDSPDIPEINHVPGHSLFGFYRSTRPSPSASQETLRPSNPSANFLLAEDDQDEEEEEDYWGNSGAIEIKRPGTPRPHGHSNMLSSEDEGESSASDSSSGGLRRTASGMFMPMGDEEGSVPPGLIGKTIDAVNTARDMFHVIMNAGWNNNN